MARFWLSALMALIGFAAVPAVAADKPSFKQADQNGDGKVAIQEATQAGVPKREAKLNDIDNDGQLTKRDWEFVNMASEAGGGDQG